jgi:hypothetical protein
MYKTRLGQWRFGKNTTEKEAKILLNVKFQRQNLGKPSLFDKHGKIISPENYLKRRNLIEYDLLDGVELAELPQHLKCRTPSPPPQFFQSSDVVRFQERLIGNIRRVFTQWRECDVREGVQPLGSRCNGTGDRMIYHLERASSYLQNSNVRIGQESLSLALKSLERDLDGRSPLAITRLIFEHRNWLHSGMIMMLWRYVAAYTLKCTHPFHQAFNGVYLVLQNHGVPAFREFLDGCVERVAEEIEKIYGESHPVAVGCWDTAEMFYNHDVNYVRICRVYERLRECHCLTEATYGRGSWEELELRYCYAFYLCYGSRGKLDEAASYVAELLEVLRASKFHDPGLEIWCLEQLARLNFLRSEVQARYSATGASLRTLEGHSRSVTAVAFSPDTVRARIVGPNIPAIAGLSETIEVLHTPSESTKRKKMEPSISRALLPSSMSQNHSNETTPSVQSNTGAMRSWITPSLEASPKANLDSVESTSTRYFECELRQDVARYCPDRSRPTHSDISESVRNNSTPEASAKVILATSLYTHVPLKLLLQKLTLS